MTKQEKAVLIEDLTTALAGAKKSLFNRYRWT
jgi:hypothetical protein